MKYEPLVSIVIPVYNGSNYLKEAIDSALAQTYKNIEIIVINDGSDDGGKTRKIALSYGEKINYYEKINGGCASALNYGISKMKGEWFSWLSHDDKYYPNKIKNSIDTVKKNNFKNGEVVINCDSDLIDESGKKIFHPSTLKTGILSKERLFYSLLFDFSINGCALLIHKNILDDIGEFDETLKYTLDFDYWLRIAIKGYSLFSFKDNLCSNRVHVRQVSVQYKDRMRPDIEKQIKKMRIKLKSLGWNLVAEYLEILWLYAYSRNYKLEAERIWEILEKNKLNLKKLKITGKKYKTKNFIISKIRYIYRMIFKKGMD